MYRNRQYHFEQPLRLMDAGIGTEAFFRAIEKELPPVVSRAEAARITGGLLSAKTLSNEDALHKGPSERVRVGSKVGYTRDALMAYLRKKIQKHTG